MDRSTIDKLNQTIHELVSLQSKFRSWALLANNSFRFEPKTFYKTIEIIQRIIEITRGSIEEEK